TPQEMRREFDLIMAWLQRKELSREDRDILQLEVRNLAPQLGESLQQEAAEKRQTRIAQALTPKGSGEGRAAIEQAVRMVDGIKPLGDGSGNYYLMYGQELIRLTPEEALSIRERSMAEMDKAAANIAEIANTAWDNVNYQANVDREYIKTAWVVS